MARESGWKEELSGRGEDEGGLHHIGFVLLLAMD